MYVLWTTCMYNMYVHHECAMDNMYVLWTTCMNYGQHVTNYIYHTVLRYAESSGVIGC